MKSIKNDYNEYELILILNKTNFIYLKISHFLKLL